MAIEDRTAERHVLSAVPVATDRQVTARHDELEFPGARFTENGKRLLLAVTVGVVAKLFENPFVPVGIVQSQENGADQILLVLREETAADVQLCDVGNAPVVRNMRPQQSAIVAVIPGE